jgi:hypothetical protein
MSKGKSKFARALDKLVKKRVNGEYKYTAKDVHALRTLLLLEVARRDEVEKLGDASKLELAMALDLIGIGAATPPDKVFGLVEKYYRGLDVNPDIFADFFDLLELLAKGKDRVEAVQSTNKAYEKLADRGGDLVAPKDGDPVPEDAEHAQTLALNLGDKVRI